MNVVYKAFDRSAAVYMDMSLELKLVIFINDGKKYILSGVVSPTVSIL